MGKHDNELILWFEEIGIEDVPMVGGKNASLGEMYQKLTSKGVAVPHGFAITAYAYQHLLKDAGIEDAIKDALAGLDTHDLRNLQERGEKARDIIRNAEFPDDLRQAIIESYKKMEEDGIALPVVHLECKYIRPAHYDGLLTIQTYLRTLPTAKITFDYEIFNEEGVRLNEGQTSLVFTDGKTGRPCRPPGALIEVLQPYFK